MIRIDKATIAKFLSKWNNNTDCDVLFIDECSTVSNDDMRGVLEKANFKLLVLVGDIYQIESIYGPVDKCQKTAETRSGPGRIGNMQIEKDGACHPFKV